MGVLSNTTKIVTLTDFTGVAQGALANNTARANNRIAINNAIQHCLANNKSLSVPPGRYEIHGGPILINGGRFRWFGTLAARFVQYSLDQPVVHVGPPLGTGGGAVVENVIFEGAELMYAGTGTANTDPQVLAGANALELTGVWMSTFRSIDIGDVNQGLGSATSVPFRGILLDGISGTTPCFSNSFRDIRIKHFGQWAIYSPRTGFDAASTGSVWENIYISGGSSDAQRDLSVNNGGAIFLTNHAGTSCRRCCRTKRFGRNCSLERPEPDKQRFRMAFE